MVMANDTDSIILGFCELDPTGDDRQAASMKRTAAAIQYV
jgi:hypothetical protein